MADNANLINAKKAKNDEFYTQLADIEKELEHYITYMHNKVVYCNCDDYRESKFWEYFHVNFAKIGLKSLVATHYSTDGIAFKAIYEGGDDNDITKGTITQLSEDGDFRSKECIDILDDSDIVVTNPPFSLLREFIAMLMSHGKKFLIIGNKNAVANKEIFPLIKSGEIKIGYNAVFDFNTPAGTIKRIGSIGWFTNLNVDIIRDNLVLSKKFSQDKYTMYNNCDAWNVDRVEDIPIDNEFETFVFEDRYISILNTYGSDCELLEIIKSDTYPDIYHIKVEKPILGVPVTFIDKYDPDKFELLQSRRGSDGRDLVMFRLGVPIYPYNRILIRRRLNNI